jgi:hypothetical protein
MRARILAVATLMAGSTLIGAGPAAAAVPPECADSVQKLAALGPMAEVAVPAACVPVGASVMVGGFTLKVPPAGEGVGVYDSLEEGVDRLTGVEVESSDGVLTARADGAGAPAEAPGKLAAPPAACSDTARAWSGKRNNGYEYFVSSAALDTGVTYQMFLDEVKFAASTIDTGRNDCGLGTGGLGINITHKGSTTLRAANIDGSCAGGDSWDVIDFGSLPAGVVGRTCTRYTPVPFADDRIVEADVRLSNRADWFRTIPSGCYNKYEMAGVLTHEFGHVFGMAHVSESSHGFLTMSTHSTPCSYVDNTWGRGDYDNLHVHY